MRHHISVWTALRATEREHWREASTSTAFNLIGGLAPLWLGSIILVATRSRPVLLDFAQNGQFALYSAALIASVFYTVVHQRSDAAFPGRPLFALIGFFGAMLAPALYVLVAPETSKAVPFANLDRRLVGELTLWLFLVSLLLSYLVQLLDNARGHPHVKSIVDRQEKELEDDFDQL